MSDQRFTTHTLDAAQSVAVLDGLILVWVRAVPSAASVHALRTHIQAARPAPWGVVHFFELERVGLPDEPTRSAYAELTRDAKASGRRTALVTERLLMQSIVRSVVSGLRLLTRHQGQIETFPSLAAALPWLETQRPTSRARLEPEALPAALEALRAAQV